MNQCLNISEESSSVASKEEIVSVLTSLLSVIREAVYAPLDPLLPVCGSVCQQEGGSSTSHVETDEIMTMSSRDHQRTEDGDDQRHTRHSFEQFQNLNETIKSCCHNSI